MKNRLALTVCVFSSSLLLAGCTDTDWDHALRYSGLKGSAEEPEAVAKPAPRPVSAPPAEAAAAPESGDMGFCRSVAMQDAGDNGFDPATQQRVYARSYAQCLTLGAR